MGQFGKKQVSKLHFKSPFLIACLDNPSQEKFQKSGAVGCRDPAPNRLRESPQGAMMDCAFDLSAVSNTRFSFSFSYFI
jgi:hypothetical protein